MRSQGLKNLLAGLALSVAGTLPAVSQTHYDANISVGAHGGLNLSRVMFTPRVSQGMLPGASFGLMFRYIEENHFGFIVELNYNQRGWKEDFDGEPFSYSRTADFIELPFLAHIYFGRRGRFFINAGPSVSLFVRESTSSNFNYKDISSIPDFPTRTTYQFTMPINAKVDYGISGSIGGEFSVNQRNAISLEARFYLGLANLLKSGRSEYIRGSNPMTISISAGYWFRIK